MRTAEATVSALEVIDAELPAPAGPRLKVVPNKPAREDRRWLVGLAAVTAVELAWWAVVWRLGLAPLPYLATYLGLAFAGLAVAVAIRLALRLKPSAAPWPEVLVGTALVGIGASAFLPLKYAIPYEMPFWLDRPVALVERALFGIDPWLLLDRLFGTATVPIDWLYGSWLPVQTLVAFSLILSRPSAAKSRALLAYGFAWFFLGVVAAMLLSSAGPLFYDRAFGGNAFAGLAETLRHRGAWVALAESDRMWAAMAQHHPGLVAGISAVPSIHVAISLWIYLTARTIAPRAAPAALIYFLFVWIGSVQLGWHYVTDGVVGSAGMLAMWQLARLVDRRPAWSGRPKDVECEHIPVRC